MLAFQLHIVPAPTHGFGRHVGALRCRLLVQPSRRCKARKELRSLSGAAHSVVASAAAPEKAKPPAADKLIGKGPRPPNGASTTPAGLSDPWELKPYHIVYGTVVSTGGADRLEVNVKGMWTDVASVPSNDAVQSPLRNPVTLSLRHRDISWAPVSREQVQGMWEVGKEVIALVVPPPEEAQEDGGVGGAAVGDGGGGGDASSWYLSTKLLERKPGDMLKNPAKVADGAFNTVYGRRIGNMPHLFPAAIPDEAWEHLQVGTVVSGRVVEVWSSGVRVRLDDWPQIHMAVLRRHNTSNLDFISSADLFAPGDRIKAVVESYGTKREKGQVALETISLEPNPGDILRRKQWVFDNAEEWLAGKAQREREEQQNPESERVYTVEMGQVVECVVTSVDKRRPTSSDAIVHMLGAPNMTGFLPAINVTAAAPAPGSTHDLSAVLRPGNRIRAVVTDPLSWNKGWSNNVNECVRLSTALLEAAPGDMLRDPAAVYEAAGKRTAAQEAYTSFKEEGLYAGKQPADFWSRVGEMCEEHTFVTVRVVREAQDGGLEVAFGPYRGSIPASHLGPVLQPGSLAAWVGKELRASLMEADQVEEHLLFSCKRLPMGQLVEGVVVSLRPSGALVRVGGVTGRLKNSAITRKFTPREKQSTGSLGLLEGVLSPGDPIRAMVESHDPERGRLELSTRRLEPQPGDMLKRPQLVYDRAEEIAALVFSSNAKEHEAEMMKFAGDVDGDGNDKGGQDSVGMQSVYSLRGPRRKGQRYRVKYSDL